MKTKSEITIFLSKEDIRDAIVLLLADRGEFFLAAHVRSNDLNARLLTDGSLSAQVSGVFAEKEIGSSAQ